MSDIALTIILLGTVSVVALLYARYLQKRIDELNALRDDLWPEAHSRLYLDADVTPAEAATMIVAVLGPVFSNQLIDALIDAFEIQPSKEQE